MPPNDIWKCVETFLAATSRKKCAMLHLVLETGVAAKIPPVQDSPPQGRRLWPPNVSGAREEKPSLKKGRRIVR